MRDECKNEKGRGIDLCEGRGIDGRQSPTQEACDRYRLAKGLMPILVEERTDPVVSNAKESRPKTTWVPPVPTVSKIGTHLAMLFEKNVGRIPCGDCKREVLRLNAMNVKQVQSERDVIISGIVARAQKQTPKLWQKVLLAADAVLHAGIAERVIGHYIDLACEQETAANGAK